MALDARALDHPAGDVLHHALHQDAAALEHDVDALSRLAFVQIDVVVVAGCVVVTRLERGRARHHAHPHRRQLSDPVLAVRAALRAHRPALEMARQSTAEHQGADLGLGDRLVGLVDHSTRDRCTRSIPRQFRTPAGVAFCLGTDRSGAMGLRAYASDRLRIGRGARLTISRPQEQRRQQSEHERNNADPSTGHSQAIPGASSAPLPVHARHCAEVPDPCNS